MSEGIWDWRVIVDEVKNYVKKYQVYPNIAIIYYIMRKEYGWKTKRIKFAIKKAIDKLYLEIDRMGRLRLIDWEEKVIEK